MRALVCIALVAAGCAREQSRAPVSAAEKYAGTWEGRSFRTGSDTFISWTSQMTAGPQGTLSGSLQFTGLQTPPIEMRTIELGDSTITFEIGPYQSPTANAEVITRSEGHLSGDSLWGEFVMLPTQGGGVVPNMTVAQWKNAEMHPNPGSEPIRGTFSAKRTPS
jgi:hypothetical protein